MNDKNLEFRVWTGTKMEYNIVVGKLGAFYALIDPKDSASLTSTSKYYPDSPIMQCTGIEDHNGKLIWEGDIVRDNSDIDDIGLGSVFFAAGTFMIDGGGSLYRYVKSLSPNKAESLYVVGNKFENKELLHN